MNKEQILNRQKHIRNFSIIAHIDHGKSTLADRILEYTGALEFREMKDQILDNMDLERERGITIKLNAVELVYRADNQEEYILHLIDTPGHVDFTYEVSRSLAACEGAVLVVDAAQGIEAQTLANVYLALDHNLEIIPLINKIDLPSANPEQVKHDIEEEIGLDASEAILASAKEGIGIRELLEAIVHKIPSPKGNPLGPVKALIFDSYYDSYRGVIPSIRVFEGTIKKGDHIKMMATNGVYEVTEVGVRTPKEKKTDFLTAGDVGYLVAGIKEVSHVHVGDTITVIENEAAEPLPGYRKLNSMVFCGIYPVESNRYMELKDALEKLHLNDAALSYEPETSQALGHGFRCGFLGLLHMDVIQERIEREFKIEIIATAPSVVYHVHLTNGEMVPVDNPSLLPEAVRIKHIEEPYIKATIMVPAGYIGPVMELCQGKRGTFLDMHYIDEKRVMMHYDLPLAEVVYDFFDKLKSMTRGYASLDYVLSSYKPSDLVKMDILLNGEKVDALTVITHRDFAYQRGRALVEKLRRLIPRQMFEIPVQAAIGGKVIARENIAALRKDVLAKCYGGDITRKKKLLEKQKEGKKRMKQVGSVEIPQSAFLAILQLDD
ncbi:MAG TPA: translation elongation factor 4 [Bacilli bacterium]|nr:translation elongation factor 4 [Bacilli bacterium]HPK59061.1 translation elongation factor 4 [Bacilli bacterium]HRU49524.1 translation elongation factor 4 [Bacilli bacterium]